MSANQSPAHSGPYLHPKEYTAEPLSASANDGKGESVTTRTSTTISPDGSDQANYISYEYSGDTVVVTDTAGKPKEFRHDSLGRVRSVWEYSMGALSLETEYLYFSDRMEIHQGAQVRTFNYDSLGRLTSETHPENGTTSYQYYATGELYARTDARGWTTNYTVDELGQVIYRSYTGDGGVTPAVQIDWDYNPNGVGRMANWGTSNGVFGGTDYDVMGRAVSRRLTIDSNPEYDLSYTCNLAGQITSTTYPDATTIYNTYNSIGQLTDMTSSLSDSQHPPNLLSALDYNASGQLESGIYGNNRQIVRGYTIAGMLQHHEVRNPAITFLNSDFEEGSGTNATSWSEWSSARSSERSLTGKYSLEVTSTTVSATQTDGYIAVQGSTTYCLSGYVYLESYSGGNIYLDLNDGHGQGQNFTDKHAVANTGLLGRWQRVSTTFTTAAATSGVKVRIVHDGGGSATFFLDQVSITQGTRTPAAAWTYDYDHYAEEDLQVVVNGGFEQSGGWSYYNSYRSTARANTGSYSGYLSSSGSSATITSSRSKAIRPTPCPATSGSQTPGAAGSTSISTTVTVRDSGLRISI